MNDAGSEDWRRLIDVGLVDEHVPLASHTTYKLGGPARLFARIDSLTDLVVVGRALSSGSLPVLILGRGSNLLVSDSGFDGLVITLGRSFGSIDLTDAGFARAGASTPLPRLARTASNAGQGGLEWCVGVPGSVGGAVRQNAGCFGAETADVLVDCLILTLGEGEPVMRPVADLDLGYRQSNVSQRQVVLSARFRTTPVDPAVAGEEMRRITRWRRDNQPGGTLNAGSVFKNPPTGSAGEIIDRLGLKDHSVRGVRVSPRHANFIEAGPSATSADVAALIADVRMRVVDATGIDLEPEVQFVGFEPGGGD